jgi:hypothetical protein
MKYPTRIYHIGADIQCLTGIFPLIFGPEQVGTDTSFAVSRFSMLSSTVGTQQSLPVHGVDLGEAPDSRGVGVYFLRDISIPPLQIPDCDD